MQRAAHVLVVVLVEVALIVLLFVVVGLFVIPALEPSVGAPEPSPTPAAARGLRMPTIQRPTQDGRKVVAL